MFQHTLPFIKHAESLAREGGRVEDILDALRKLSIDDYGLLLISLPNVDYPALSEMLPAMASEDVQKAWTGASGQELLKQTATFTRQLENNFVRYAGRPLHGSSILDFGCGYGRFMRMMYYYSNPEKIWGVDAWDRSLALCIENRVLGNLVQSDRVPETLPVNGTKFDMVFAFSVFTHLAPAAAKACLSAIRKHVAPDGLMIATFRPVEFWPFIDQIRKTAHAEEKMRDHARQGFAYLPHNGVEGETYGDISADLSFFAVPGWEILGYDYSLADMYQPSVILRPSEI